MYRELFDPLPKLVRPVGQDQPSDCTEKHKLERQINQAVTSQEVITAIEKLFQATPPNQHRGIVLQVQLYVEKSICNDVMMISYHSGWGRQVDLLLWNQCLIT